MSSAYSHPRSVNWGSRLAPPLSKMGRVGGWARLPKTYLEFVAMFPDDAACALTEANVTHGYNWLKSQSA